MWESAEESNRTISLPYGLLISQILVDRLNLSKYRPTVINASQNSLSFSSMGYLEVGNKWVKKNFVQERAEAAKPTKISTDSTVLLLKYSEELKTRIVAIECGLETLQDAIEKVFLLQKESTTDNGKLRIAMTGIKQKGIATFN